MGALSLWYERISMESLRAETSDKLTRQTLSKSIAKARERTKTFCPGWRRTAGRPRR